MSELIQKALQVVRTTPNEEFEYLAACHFLATNRAELTHRVFINLPGGLSANSDPRWEDVKQNSEERCSCGNERVILPGNPRTTFEASDAAIVVISPQNAIYIKPVGGDRQSAFMKLWIESEALAFVADPFAPLVFSMDLFSTQGYPLSRLVKILPTQPTPPVMFTGKEEEKTPLFAITAVDPAARTVSITLDKAVEVFDPNSEPERHGCADGRASS